MVNDYSRKWKLYFAFKFVFNDRSGLILSSCIMMVICGIINPASVGLALTGAGIGLIISVINGLMFRYGVIKPKKKVEYTLKRGK